MFVKCPRWWYYQYIQTLPVIQDTCYMDAGTVIHHTLQKYYEKEIVDIDALKAFFMKEWDKFKLDASKISSKKYGYWDMVLNGANLKKEFTSVEMMIFYPEEIVAYLDCVNTTDDEICDWKSSTRTEENELEYRQQLLLYSWLYKRKIGRLPKKATVYYLKYAGSKGEMSFSFTDDDIVSIEQWFRTVSKQMDDIVAKKELPDRCQRCHQYCPFTDVCFTKTDMMNFTLNIKGNFIYVSGPFTPLLHKGIEKKFSYELKNAHFIKKARPMANTTVNFWNMRHNRLPVGFMTGLIKTLNDYAAFKKSEIKINVLDHREFDNAKITMPDKFVNGRELRDYQRDAVEEFLKHKIGILEVGTGGGKTELAIELMRRLGTRALFIVDKVELLKQTKARIEDALGIEVGQIGYGEDNIKDITVATIQTLTKHLHKYESYLSGLRFVILDEAHKIAARSFYNLGMYLRNTEYRLGLCLDKRTEVIMSNGHTRSIKDIKKGDNVLSYNEDKKKIEEDIIKNIFESDIKEGYEISVRKKNGNIKKIKCSGNHKFFVDNCYIAAKDLLIGQKLIVVSGMHCLLDNNSRKQESRKKISEKLKGRKNTWWHKNSTLWKKGHKTWNKGKTKYDFSQIASHRKGISIEKEYGDKAISLRNKMSFVAKKAWKEKYDDIIFKYNSTRANSIKYPWLTYNRRRKIQMQTNEKGQIICEFCGKPIEGYKQLHCHHIDKNKKNNSLNNIMIVHAKCHTYLDNHKKDKNGRFIKCKKN